jgi:hypothetical protein
MITSLWARCRICSGLQFRSQAQTRKARLITKAKNICGRLWEENNKLMRPYYSNAIRSLSLPILMFVVSLHASERCYGRPCA